MSGTAQLALNPAPPKTGRPTKLTPELQEKICHHLAQGNYASIACLAVGIHQDTLTDWKQRGELGEEPYSGFLQAVKAAEAQAEVHLVTLVGDIAAYDRQWAAAMTLLERRHPARWGRHDRVDHELSQQGMELLQRLREIGERPAVMGPVVEGEAKEIDGP